MLPAFAGHLPVYGHRGARGLMPENTLPAYKEALALGVDYLDMDVGMTRDGVLVVTHNLALNPNITKTPSGHWLADKHHYIWQMPFHTLEQYDVGGLKPGTKYASYFPNQQSIPHTHIPTLASVIEFGKKYGQSNLGFQIEMKTNPNKPYATTTPKQMASALAALLEREGVADRVEVQAFDWRCLRALQRIDPAIKTAYLTDDAMDKVMLSPDPKVAGRWTAGYLLKNYSSIPAMVKALGGSLWDPQESEVKRKDIQTAHALGLKVIVWALVNKPGFNPEKIQNMVHDGVDGIITDRPDLVLALV